MHLHEMTQDHTFEKNTSTANTHTTEFPKTVQSESVKGCEVIQVQDITNMNRPIHGDYKCSTHKIFYISVVEITASVLCR